MSTNELRLGYPGIMGDDIDVGDMVVVDVATDVMTGNTYAGVYGSIQEFKDSYTDAEVYWFNERLAVTCRTSDGVIDVTRHALSFDTMVGYLCDNTPEDKPMAIMIEDGNGHRSKQSVFYTQRDFDAAVRIAQMFSVGYQALELPARYDIHTRRYVYDDRGAGDELSDGWYYAFTFPPLEDSTVIDLDFSALDEPDDQGAVERDMSRRARAAAKGQSTAISSKKIGRGISNRSEGVIRGDVK